MVLVLQTLVATHSSLVGWSVEAQDPVIQGRPRRQMCQRERRDRVWSSIWGLQAVRKGLLDMHVCALLPRTWLTRHCQLMLLVRLTLRFPHWPILCILHTLLISPIPPVPHISAAQFTLHIPLATHSRTCTRMEHSLSSQPNAPRNVLEADLVLSIQHLRSHPQRRIPRGGKCEEDDRV